MLPNYIVLLCLSVQGSNLPVIYGVHGGNGSRVLEAISLSVETPVAYGLSDGLRRMVGTSLSLRSVVM